MPKKLFMCLFFGCFGITVEIFFTALSNLLNHAPLLDEPLWSLAGKTYVWMFPIYTLIPIAGGFLIDLFRKYPLLLRLLLYTSIIFAVEFTAGFLLDQLIGKCPWEYNSGWHVMGYIRLDFAPAWMFFSFLIENLYRYLDKRL